MQVTYPIISNHAFARKHALASCAMLAIIIAAVMFFAAPSFAFADDTNNANATNSLQAQEQAVTKDTPTALATEDEHLRAASSETKLSATDHVQNIGTTTKPAVTVGETVEIGTEGKALRLEEFSLDIESDTAGSIQYEAHVQYDGWQGKKFDGEKAGTEGQSKRIEAVTINLTGDLATTYDIWYRAHAQNIGWMGWAKNGEKSGTSAQSLRLEALQICLLLAGSAAPGSTNNAYSAPAIVGNAHVQNVGWSSASGDPVTFGTVGQGLRVEALTLSLGEGAPAAGTITYTAHVQDYGWMSPVSNGAVAGTTGEGKRIEAIKMTLSGDIASNYKLYYHAHVANVGWLGWTTGNEIAGTTDSAVRIEAIQVMLVKNSDPAPTSTAPAYLAPSLVTGNIGVWVNGNGDWTVVPVAHTAGTEGEARALLGLKAEQTSSWGGHINYETHLSNIGWTSTSSDGAQSGTLDGNNRIEAFRMWLDGELGNYYDIYYRSHLSGYGWMGWAANGNFAGSSGLGRNTEAIQVCFTVKGGAAPGPTENSFSDQNGFLGDHVKQNMINIAQGYSSSTGMLMLVDNDACKVGVFTGWEGNWSLAQYWDCANGRDDSPSPRGVYHIGSKGYSFGDDDHTCFYYSQITGNYLFHSILYEPYQGSPRDDNILFDGLGGHFSNGCIRLATDNAYWVYANVPGGTTIVSYN